uniref:Secreted protein n=1 Tax=Anguilla anguilla TaxID=7936 RepID=A0A0E9X135_ANGAN
MVRDLLHWLHTVLLVNWQVSTCLALFSLSKSAFPLNNMGIGTHWLVSYQSVPSVCLKGTLRGGRVNHGYNCELNYLTTLRIPGLMGIVHPTRLPR